MLALRGKKTLKLSGKWGGVLFMTQEGKPLPFGRRVLAIQPPPVPNPSPDSRRHRSPSLGIGVEVSSATCQLP